MVERFKGETILAHWMVEPAALDQFVRETRLRLGWFSYVPKDLLKECEKHAAGVGLEVVVREDAVFAGAWGAANSFSGVRVHETWIEFIGDEGYCIPVPLAPGARGAANRIAAIYAELDARARAESQRQFDEERAKPTWNNRLLLFTEAHIGWVVLGFFFVLLPLCLLLYGFLVGRLSR